MIWKMTSSKVLKFADVTKVFRKVTNDTSVGNFPGNKSISQDGGKYREILGNMESMFLPGYLTLDAMTICSWVIWLIINNTLSILSIS